MNEWWQRYWQSCISLRLFCNSRQLVGTCLSRFEFCRLFRFSLLCGMMCFWWIGHMHLYSIYIYVPVHVCGTIMLRLKHQHIQQKWNIRQLGTFMESYGSYNFGIIRQHTKNQGTCMQIRVLRLWTLFIKKPMNSDNGVDSDNASDGRRIASNSRSMLLTSFSNVFGSICISRDYQDLLQGFHQVFTLMYLRMCKL